MNPAIRKSLTVGEVRSWLPRLLACGLLIISLAGWTADEHTLADLAVHEWGTFTAIAGKDGRAIEWLPLGLPQYPPSTELPQFVEHINSVNFKLGLRGTIRMETPVLYFYSPRDVTVRNPDRYELKSYTVGWKHRVDPGRGFSESRWRVPQRRADESLLRRSRDRFLAAPRPKQCRGAAGEVSFLSRSFRWCAAPFREVDLRRKTLGQES